MWSKLVCSVFVAVMCVAFGVQLSAQGATQAPATPTKVVEQVVTETATVQAIDVAEREVTLKGPLGDVETVTVSEDVKRLDEVKVGDTVTAKYYIGIAAELRAPTAEERPSRSK
jgi:Cu/Ag efflux protein CusF